MKQMMIRNRDERKWIVVFLLLCLTSCGSFVSNMVSTAFLPISNKEVVVLQRNLIGYRFSEKVWPEQVEHFTDFCDSVKSPLPANFKEIYLIKHNDSLDVSYRLTYTESDSVPYRLMTGAFMITLRNDSAIAIQVTSGYAERHDGTVLFKSTTASSTQEAMQEKLKLLEQKKSINKQ